MRDPQLRYPTTLPEPRLSVPPADGRSTPTRSLASKITSSVLTLWRARVSEIQALDRLLTSLLHAPTGISADRRRNVDALYTLELRAIAQLPRPDLWALANSTVQAKGGSGAQLVMPDVAAAERDMLALRDALGQAIVSISHSLADAPETVAEALDRADRVLDELLRLCDTLDAALDRRAVETPDRVHAVLEEAAEKYDRDVTIAGDFDAHVLRSAGLVRLLAEMLAAGCDEWTAEASYRGTSVEIELAPAHRVDITPERVAFYQLVAFLLDVHARYAEGAWRVVVPAAVTT